MSKQRLLVIGNGMVGQRFLEELVAKTEAFDITVLGEEIRPAYDRVQLSAWFSGTPRSQCPSRRRGAQLDSGPSKSKFHSTRGLCTK